MEEIDTNRYRIRKVRGISLVVQWLELYFPMQRVQV